MVLLSAAEAVFGGKIPLGLFHKPRPGRLGVERASFPQKPSLSRFPGGRKSDKLEQAGRADVAKLADALDLGSSSREGV